MKHKIQTNDYKHILGNILTRYVLCVLGSVGLGIVYGLKTNFHVAIVSMVNHTAIGGAGHDGASKEVNISID